MKALIITPAFRRDLKRYRRRGADLDRLDMVVHILRTDDPLPARCRPHKLQGDWDGVWECHVASDWLLIYEFTETTLTLHRTGTHPDLF